MTIFAIDKPTLLAECVGPLSLVFVLRFVTFPARVTLRSLSSDLHPVPRVPNWYTGSNNILKTLEQRIVLRTESTVVRSIGLCVRGSTRTASQPIGKHEVKNLPLCQEGTGRKPPQP